MTMSLRLSFAAFASFALACSGEPATSTPTEPPEAVAETAPSEPTPPVEPATPDPDPEPPPAPPIDLLHAVATRVRVSTALGGNVAQVERLYDGDMESAWNSQSGDLVGAFVEVQVPSDAEVTSIELTSGFTRNQRGRDLFHGNHRVRRVRVVRDGAEVGRFPLDVESQALQSLAVTGPGGVYRIEILETLAGTQPTWTEACISELRVLGRAPNASAGSTQPTAAVVPEPERAEILRLFAVANGAEERVPALVDEDGNPIDDGDIGIDDSDEEVGEYDDEVAAGPAMASDPADGPVLATREEGIHLTELTLASNVEERQAVDPRQSYSRASDERVYCLVRLENPDREATTLVMRWENVDNPERGSDRDVNVPTQARYVTWGYTGTRGRAGRYRCVIRDAQDNVLGSIAYELTE
jgi:hypothetical protein